jgi:hypothetical protein
MSEAERDAWAAFDAAIIADAQAAGLDVSPGLCLGCLNRRPTELYSRYCPTCQTTHTTPLCAQCIGDMEDDAPSYQPGDMPAKEGHSDARA